MQDDAEAERRLASAKRERLPPAAPPPPPKRRAAALEDDSDDERGGLAVRLDRLPTLVSATTASEQTTLLGMRRTLEDIVAPPQSRQACMCMMRAELQSKQACLAQGEGLKTSPRHPTPIMHAHVS